LSVSVWIQRRILLDTQFNQFKNSRENNDERLTAGGIAGISKSLEKGKGEKNFFLPQALKLLVFSSQLYWFLNVQPNY